MKVFPFPKGRINLMKDASSPLSDTSPESQELKLSFNITTKSF